MFAPKLWAIDLGRSAVKGVFLTRVRDGVEILDADIVPLVGPSPEDLKEPSRDVRLWEALSEFQRRHDIRKHRIAIAIPGQNALVREIKVALVGKRSLEELVAFEASNAIPFLLDEVLWDYHVFDSPEDKTTKEGIIFAVKRTTIHTYLHAFSQIGAERVVEITLAPLAALSFLQFEMGQRGSALLLDLGAENTSVIVMDGPRFWVRSLMSGGYRITGILERKFELSFDQAEEAKQNIGRSELAGALVGVIKPALHDLIAELKTNLQYCERIRKSSEIERIYAVGGGSRLTGLKAQIRQSLGPEVCDIRSVERVFVAPEANVRLVRSNLDRLSVAIGTGIKALQAVPIRVSFVPEAMARETRIASTRRFLLAAGVLLWGILLAAFIFAQQYRVHLARAASSAEEASVHYSRNLARLEAAKNTSAVETELAYLQSIGIGRAQAAAILTEVVNIFEQASRRPGCRFQLSSFECTVVGDPAQPGALRELSISIGGRVVLPLEADPEMAYERLKDRLLGGLRASALLARSTGTAKFKNESKAVAGNATRWRLLVQSGDQMMAHKDGVWYTIDKVQSDIELLLTEPFRGGDLESEFSIARVNVADFDTDPSRTREFRLGAQVPAQLDGAAGDTPKTPVTDSE